MCNIYIYILYIVIFNPQPEKKRGKLIMFDPVDPPSSFVKNLAPGKLRQLDQEGRTSHWLPTDARIRTGTMIGGAGFLSETNLLYREIPCF